MPWQALDAACEVSKPRSSGGRHRAVVSHQWDYWTASPAPHCKVGYWHMLLWIIYLLLHYVAAQHI